MSRDNPTDSTMLELVTMAPTTLQGWTEMRNDVQKKMVVKILVRQTIQQQVQRTNQKKFAQPPHLGFLAKEKKL